MGRCIGKSLMELKQLLTWDGMEQELRRAMTDEEIMDFLASLCKPFAPGFPDFWPNLQAATPERMSHSFTFQYRAYNCLTWKNKAPTIFVFC